MVFKHFDIKRESTQWIISKHTGLWNLLGFFSEKGFFSEDMGQLLSLWLEDE